MPITDITDWGDAVFLSLSNALNAFLVAIPLVIGALLIIIVGWIIAGLLARLTSEILRPSVSGNVKSKRCFSSRSFVTGPAPSSVAASLRLPSTFSCQARPCQ